MAIAQETVKYVAHLARVELKAAELEKVSRQLQDILDFIDKLKGIDIKDISPTSHILPINNVFREDKLQKSLPPDKILRDTPQKEGNFFAVPKVIE